MFKLEQITDKTSSPLRSGTIVPHPAEYGLRKSLQLHTPVKSQNHLCSAITYSHFYRRYVHALTKFYPFTKAAYVTHNPIHRYESAAKSHGSAQFLS